ncbi:MAG: 4Fe-4S binding protein [Ruminococcus sp.]|nr:4Fe-4S binding protein [Ruminococcus sp.]
MAYKITDACLSCGTCESACPVGAISEGESTYKIDADTCISCGACSNECPVSAIEAD